MQCKSYSHFFSKKFQHICVSFNVNFNESLTNDIVSFEQLGHGIWGSSFRLLIGKFSQFSRVICLPHNSGKVFSFHVLMIRYSTIGIKHHGFSCINIRQVPWEVLKIEAGGRGFQLLPRDLVNVNALKNHVRLLLLHKN